MEDAKVVRQMSCDYCYRSNTSEAIEGFESLFPDCLWRMQEILIPLNVMIPAVRLVYNVRRFSQHSQIGVSSPGMPMAAALLPILIYQWCVC